MGNSSDFLRKGTLIVKLGRSEEDLSEDFLALYEAKGSSDVLLAL